MISVNPYLNFMGKTEEAMKFYATVFGKDLDILQRYSDIPNQANVAENERNMVMHTALTAGSSIIMATDSLESMGQTLVEGTNISLAITAESKEEADKLFTGLSEGGKVTMPIQDTFWGDYFGMLTDRYNIQWMVSYPLPKE